MSEPGSPRIRLTCSREFELTLAGRKSTSTQMFKVQLHEASHRAEKCFNLRVNHLSLLLIPCQTVGAVKKTNIDMKVHELHIQP